MKKFLICVSALTLFNTGRLDASAALSASVSGSCSAPVAGTNVTVTGAGADRFAVSLAATLPASTITPGSGNVFSLQPSGTVCRFGVTSPTGTIAPAANFLGMTFANPNLAVRNSNLDATGRGTAGSAINTVAFTIGALSSTVLSITTGGGNGVEIQRRATGTTNFAFSSTAAITLTGYPTNESSLTSTGNSFVTIPITLTALAG